MKREAIAQLLPAVFQRTLEPESPLSAILGVMEQLHAPSEEILRNLSAALNPRSAPDRFLPYLSRWVNLDWLFETMLEDWTRDSSRPVPYPPGLGSMRELVALSFRLNRESGTAKGLLLFLRTATGEAQFSIEENPAGPDGLPLPFHIRIHAPQSTAQYQIILQRIVEFEKPAYVTYELVFDSVSQTVT